MLVVHDYSGFDRQYDDVKDAVSGELERIEELGIDDGNGEMEQTLFDYEHAFKRGWDCESYEDALGFWFEEVEE